MPIKAELAFCDKGGWLGSHKRVRDGQWSEVAVKLPSFVLLNFSA